MWELKKKEKPYEEIITFTRGERVLVRDSYRDQQEAIYLTTIEWATHPYQCVFASDEGKFKKWEVFKVEEWKQIKKIPEIEEMTLAEVCEALGKNIKIVK